MEDRLVPLWKPEISEVEEMRTFLKSRLIGQDEAIDEISNLFIARAVRSSDDRRPFMSVFLNGTSGVGKTLLFELVGEFWNQNLQKKKSHSRIPVTKIALNGVFAFELVEMVSGLTSGAKNAGDSKKSKFEELFESSWDADDCFARHIVVLDEFDKLGKSLNWSEKNAMNSLEILDDAIPTVKHADGTRIDISNWIIICTGNYFLNEVQDPKTAIGFSIPDETPVMQEEKSPPNIDKEAVIEKMRRHFSISAFNRWDKFIVFNDLSQNNDLRRGFAEKEIQKMFDTIDTFYTSRGNPLPDIEQYGNFETLVQEALEKSERNGGFRSIKRYVQNSLLGRILSKLHGDYPNISPADRERKRRSAHRSGSQEEVSKDENEFMEAFGMEDMAKVLNNINYE